MLRLPKARGTNNSTMLSIPYAGVCVSPCHKLHRCLANVFCITALSYDRIISVHAHSWNSGILSQFASFFWPTDNSVLHIQHTAAKIAFLACCLDILTEAMYFLCNTRRCLFVVLFTAFVAFLLCLLSLAPSWILSSCLNADWIPVLITWLFYFQITLMVSLVGDNNFLNMIRDSYLAFFFTSVFTTLLAYRANGETCQHLFYWWATILICVTVLPACIWPVVSYAFVDSSGAGTALLYWTEMVCNTVDHVLCWAPWKQPEEKKKNNPFSSEGDRAEWPAGAGLRTAWDL